MNAVQRRIYERMPDDERARVDRVHPELRGLTVELWEQARAHEAGLAAGDPVHVAAEREFEAQKTAGERKRLKATLDSALAGKLGDEPKRAATEAVAAARASGAKGVEALRGVVHAIVSAQRNWKRTPRRETVDPQASLPIERDPRFP